MIKCSRFGNAHIDEVKAVQKGISRWLMHSFKFIRGKDVNGSNLTPKAKSDIRQNLAALKCAIAIAKQQDHKEELDFKAQLDLKMQSDSKKQLDLSKMLALQMHKLIPPSLDRFERLVENFSSVPDAIKAHIATYLPEKRGLCFIREQIKANNPSGLNMLISFIKTGHVPLQALELTAEEIQGLSLDMGLWQNVTKYVLDRSDMDIYLSIIRTALSSTHAEEKQVIAAYRAMVDLISLGYCKISTESSLEEEQLLTSHEIAGIVTYIDKILITFNDQPLRCSYSDILAILSQLLKSRPDMAMTHWIKYVNAGMSITRFAEELKIVLTPAIKARITYLCLNSEVDMSLYKKTYDFEGLDDFIGSFPKLKHLDITDNIYNEKGFDLSSLPPNCEQLISLHCSAGGLKKLLTMPSLRYLNCSNSDIEMLPAGLTNLRNLIWRGSKLKELPEDLHALEIFICTNSNLVSFPRGMVSLKLLDVNSSSSLTSLSSDMSALLYVNCSDCPKLDALPAEVETLEYIEKTNERMRLSPRMEMLIKEQSELQKSSLYDELLKKYLIYGN